MMKTSVENIMDAFEFQIYILLLDGWLFLVLACFLDGYVCLAVGALMIYICYMYFYVF